MNSPELPVTFEEVHPTGSRFIVREERQAELCANSDHDWLCLWTGDRFECAETLDDNDWELGGSCPNGQYFNSFTNGEFNLIVCWDREFYDKFVAATHEAKRLGLDDKDERLKLFKSFLYGEVVQ